MREFERASHMSELACRERDSDLVVGRQFGTFLRFLLVSFKLRYTCLIWDKLGMRLLLVV